MNCGIPGQNGLAFHTGNTHVWLLDSVGLALWLCWSLLIYPGVKVRDLNKTNKLSNQSVNNVKVHYNCSNTRRSRPIFLVVSWALSTHGVNFTSVFYCSELPRDSETIQNVCKNVTVST